MDKIKSNEDVLEEANPQRLRVTGNRKRQSTFFVHMTGQKLDYVITMEHLQGKRSRDKNKRDDVDSLASRHEETSVIEMIGSTCYC